MVRTSPKLLAKNHPTTGANGRNISSVASLMKELAFYDAVSTNHASVYAEPFLRDLIHKVVQSIKQNLKVDWTEPHSENVRDAVRSAVRRVLRRPKVKPEDFDSMLNKVIEHAAVLYAVWPLAA